MDVGRAKGPVVTTIDRKGQITSLNRVSDTNAAEGLTPDDVVGSSALATRGSWGIAGDHHWDNVSRCLLNREERRFQNWITTPRGNRYSITIHAVPIPKGAVLITYDEHHGLPLEPSEIEVLTLLSHGLTHAMAARRLKISESSSKRHMENARRKLGAKSGTHAVALAIRRGIIQ